MYLFNIIYVKIIIGSDRMNNKIIKIEEQEEIKILNTDNSGLLIKKQNNRLIISELNKNLKQNVYIQKLNMEELSSFILIHLLENNNISENFIKDNHILINNIMDNYYNYICGNFYNADDIKKIEFQAITYFN